VRLPAGRLGRPGLRQGLRWSTLKTQDGDTGGCRRWSV